MPIEGLTIIGESINDSVPSTHRLFEANDINGILELARFQEEKGAAYIDVNIGRRAPGVMADLVRQLQEVSAKPLSIDTPDPEIAAAGLEAYDPAKAGGALPILNSIAEARLNMFELYALQPFFPILLITEQIDASGVARANKTAQETYATAKKMIEHARGHIEGFSPENCILDPGIAPIGSDSEGNFKRLMESIKKIHEDSDFSGVNMSVGLSNFTVTLPAKCADGSPVKSALESAFLTMAMPLGMNMVVGSVKRAYKLLPEDHPAMRCLKDVLELEGIEAVQRVLMYVYY